MSENLLAADWIKILGLTEHPEGGYYKENYRSTESIGHKSLPPRFKGPRVFATSIYYLLEGKDFSQFHRIASDEIWHFYAGSNLEIHCLSAKSGYRKFLLGNRLPGRDQLQVVIPAGDWFAACLQDTSGWALAGCTVAPGFDFADFEIARASELLKDFPAQAAVIHQLTRNKEDA